MRRFTTDNVGNKDNGDDDHDDDGDDDDDDVNTDDDNVANRAGERSDSRGNHEREANKEGPTLTTAHSKQKIDWIAKVPFQLQ